MQCDIYLTTDRNILGYWLWYMFLNDKIILLKMKSDVETNSELKIQKQFNVC